MKIISSVGQQNTIEKARKMILAGTDIIRFNFSRYSIEKNIEIIRNVHNVVDDLSSKIKILIDMPVNKVRLGHFDEHTFAIHEGQPFTCRSADYSPSCNDFIPINTDKLGLKVKNDQLITIGNGEVALQVTEIVDQDTIKVKATNNGLLRYLKTFNIEAPGTTKAFIDKYSKILDAVLGFIPDYIVVPYVDSEINEEIKKIIISKREKHEINKIIIKIDSEQGINAIEDILKDDFYDMCLLDRGELGVSMPYEQLGITQKNISKVALKNKKKLIISTQILDSTINNLIPLRAEILDITNMVLDGIYAIMLCDETGINIRPAYTINVAKKIINQVEKFL